MYTASTVDEWTAILGVAAKWNFKSIRALAIRQLDSIASPVDKIVLGRKYEIVDWLSDAYKAVCMREDALSIEEGVRLGMEEVIKISALRQKNIRIGPFLSLPEAIQEIFGLGSTNDKNEVVDNPNNIREAKMEDSLTETGCKADTTTSQPIEVADEERKKDVIISPIVKPLTKVQLKRMRQQEAKERADREFQEQLEKDLASEAEAKLDYL